MERCAAKIGLLAILLILLPKCAAAEPQWIWGTENANQEAPVGTCLFRKTFKLAEEPARGRIEITCDNRYVLRLNGRLVGASNRWQVMDRYDVTKLLKAGENVLDVRCVNDEQAAGLVALVQVRAADGSIRDYSTDESWQGAIQQGRSWDPAVFNQVKQARVYSSGALGKTQPWGKAVKLAAAMHRVGSSPTNAGGELELADGDRVLLIGNTLIERAQQYGYWETALTARHPERHIVFRNLGWSGDTVFGHARARFGSVADGYQHLVEHAYAVKPTVILIAYGTNEAFGGLDALGKFEEGLHRLLDVLEQTGARLVLLSPQKLQELDPPLPDPAEQNEVVRIYRDTIRETAMQRGHTFVDLFARLVGGSDVSLDERHPVNRLTDNGLHLSQYGYWRSAPILLDELNTPWQPWSIAIDAEEGSIESRRIEIEKLGTTGKQLRFTATASHLPLPRLPEHAPEEAAALAPRPELRIDKLAPGTYRLEIDGHSVATATASRWQQGVRLAAGPDFAQAEKLREAIVRKNRLYFHRWRPQNETYLYLFRKHEQGNNAREIPQFDPLVEKLEAEIARLRVPGSHTYQLIRVEN